MKSILLPRRFVHALGLATLAASACFAAADNWPTWRGPHANGISTETDLPARWSATENIRWKVALPDRGNSTPIVWGNRVFLTQAVEKENRRSLMCLDRATGRQIWQQGVTYAEKEDTHETNPQCSSSPVTDGERVIAWFGSAGLHAYDLDGKKLWSRDLGKQTHEWGYGGSPIIHGDRVFLNFGPGPRTFLVALDKKSGQTLWQVDVAEKHPAERTDGFAGRQGYIGSWSAPIIVNAGEREELVMSFPGQLRAFDPASGKELWFCEGLNPLVYTSPVHGEGVVVAMGGFMGTTIAVKPGGQGDVTKTHKLWQTQRTKNRLGSAVIHKGHIYVLNMDGIAECLELQTGKQVWVERLKGAGAKSESWSSMVLAGDRIYVTNQSADTLVLRASPTFELISSNGLDGEMTNSSPAVSNGSIFIRTHKHLWCVSDRSRQTAMR